MEIVPYDGQYRSDVLTLSLRAWAPVFAELEPAVPSYVYSAFYPQGWEARQAADIARFLDEEPAHVLVAIDGKTVVGWAGIRLHADDMMGEIYILAVDPAHQRQGIASALIETAINHMRHAGMKIAMVETGGDPGHDASRMAYERNGFERWPVARYFRKL